jgi:hypothetical protein
MVDMLDRDDSRQVWGCGGFGRFAKPRTGRSEAAKPAAAIDETDVDVAEADDVVAGLKLGDADEFAGQRLADEDEFAFPHDLAGAANTTDLVIRIVPGVFRANRHGAPRGRVALRGQLLPERFVRTLFIVMPAESIETCLLFGSVRCRGPRGLGFERAMHPLVSAVLLRRGRMNEVRLHAEFEPPCGKPRQATGPTRSEGRTIVAADGEWQPISPKGFGKDRQHPSIVGGAIRTSIRKRVWPSVIVSGSIRR